MAMAQECQEDIADTLARLGLKESNTNDSTDHSGSVNSIYYDALENTEASEGLDLLDRNDDKKQTERFFEHRKYQEELIQLAKTTNIIACLPTGSGKTYIALRLTEHFVTHVKEGKKKIVFVACTIPLLLQQRKVFETHTPYKCNAFSGSGSEKFDNSSYSSFRLRFDQCEVILMTPQYFQNLLTANFIQLKELALLIFDECHHATNGNPMNQIMGIYREFKLRLPTYPLPKILGLSATVVVKNLNLGSGLENELIKMEKRLDCIAVTYDLENEVDRYSTNAKVNHVVYHNTEIQAPGYEQELFLSPITRAIDFLSKLPIRLKFDQEHQMNHPLNPLSLLLHGKSYCDTIQNVLQDILIHTPILGPYCALHVAIIKIGVIKNQLSNSDEKVKTEMYQMVLSELRKFVHQGKVMLPCAFEVAPIDSILSDKVLKTLDVLKRYKDKQGTDEELSGLIFCQRITTTFVLKEVLLHMKKVNREDFGFISAEIVVGSNCSRKLPPSHRIKIAKQTEVIQGFRQKKYNLLLCTSVLEEGLDVPSCNLVLRFDPVQNFTSFIQSMGRARKKDAKYFILINKEAEDKERFQITRFKCVNEALTEKLKSHLKTIKLGEIPIEEEYDDDEGLGLDVGIPDFCPNGPLQAKVTAFSCISLVTSYANKVCTTSQSVKCWDWYDKYDEKEDCDGHKIFRANITLPLGTPIPNRIVQGVYMKSKCLAKKSAFMEAVKLIYSAGGFDNNFLPVVKPISVCGSDDPDSE